MVKRSTRVSDYRYQEQEIMEDISSSMAEAQRLEPWRFNTLFCKFRLPLSPDPNHADQDCDSSGCKVISTASKHNHPLLKSLGVEQVFDYKDPSCAQQIREYTKDSLTLVLDCIAEGTSPKICSEAISSSGGTISYLLKAEHERADVENKRTLGYTVMGEAFEKFGGKSPAKPEDFEFCREFWKLSEGLIGEGKVRPHPVRVGEKGLEGVFEGMQMLREGKVSGVKLVYRVGETPK